MQIYTWLTNNIRFDFKGYFVSLRKLSHKKVNKHQSGQTRTCQFYFDQSKNRVHRRSLYSPHSIRPFESSRFPVRFYTDHHSKLPNSDGKNSIWNFISTTPINSCWVYCTQSDTMMILSFTVRIVQMERCIPTQTTFRGEHAAKWNPGAIWNPLIFAQIAMKTNGNNS